MNSIPCCAAVIVAGGKGLRLNSQIPKQYLPLEGRPILARTLDIFEASHLISRIILVIGEGQQAFCADKILSLGYKKIDGLVIGGAERQDSVYKGLKAAAGDELVIIHDGARPFVTQKELEEVVAAAAAEGAAILARPLSETIKKSGPGGRIAATLDRSMLWVAQTPQVFSYSLLLQAYEKARQDNLAATDDAAVVEHFGHSVSLVSGSPLNIKITGPEDLALGSAIIKSGWPGKVQLEKEENKDAGRIEIYTDGACSGNPGPGGYGTVLLYKGNRKELSGGFRLTTNNRMEILSVIKGLEALKEPSSVRLYSDSRYVVDAIEKGWVKRWKKNNWMRNKEEPAQNSDLWRRLLELLEIHQASFQWVKGHANNPGNERCDQLARAAIEGELEADEFYEALTIIP